MKLALLALLAGGCGRVGFAPVDAAPCGPHDEDGDGVPDACDACPHLFGSQDDTDGDGVGDACDPDPDAVNRIVAFYSFEDAAQLEDFELGATAPGTWAHSGDDLLVTNQSALVAQARLLAAPAVGFTIQTGVELVTIDGPGGANDSRDVAFLDQLAASPAGGETAVYAGPLSMAEATQPYPTTLEMFYLDAGARSTALESGPHSRDYRDGDEITMTLHRTDALTTVTVDGNSLAHPPLATSSYPGLGPFIGLRSRGTTARFHYLVVID